MDNLTIIMDRVDCGLIYSSLTLISNETPAGLQRLYSSKPSIRIFNSTIK